MADLMKRKRSSVWQHFSVLNAKDAICNICEGKFRYETTTTNLKRHMQVKHPTVKRANTKNKLFKQTEHTAEIGCEEIITTIEWKLMDSMEDIPMIIDEDNLSIGFIGAGTMAQIIANKLIESEIVKPEFICVSAPSSRNLVKWGEMGCDTTNENDQVTAKCDVVFLAVKPQQLDSALNCFRPAVKIVPKTRLLISILVGVSIETLRSKFDKIRFGTFRIIRLMPNAPIEIGYGCTLMSVEENTPPEFVVLVKKLMQYGGVCEQIPEALMNVAGAITGSGPAFVYTIIQSLSDAVVKQGLPRELSYRLISHLMEGSAKMVLETGKHPAELKDNICSPGGSTIYGLEALEMSGIRNCLTKTIDATIERTEQIANMHIPKKEVKFKK